MNPGQASRETDRASSTDLQFFTVKAYSAAHPVFIQ